MKRKQEGEARVARVGATASHLDLAIGGAREEGVGMDVEAAHHALMPDEHERLLHRIEVPHANLAILATSVDRVITHRQAIDLCHESGRGGTDRQSGAGSSPQQRAIKCQLQQGCASCDSVAGGGAPLSPR